MKITKGNKTVIFAKFVHKTRKQEYVIFNTDGTVYSQWRTGYTNFHLKSRGFINYNYNKTYCSTVHFRRITSIYQPTNAHIISHKTLLKHFKTLRHVSILSDHHQEALFLAKVIVQYSQFNSYLQTRCCGSISCCVVEQWLGVRRSTHT